jgi:ketol-acid reductoisomerase
VPIFEQLYESVKNGTETRKSLEFNGRSTYRQDLARELDIIDNQEIWQAGMLYIFAVCRILMCGFLCIAGKTVRSLRPDYKPASE